MYVIDCLISPAPPPVPPLRLTPTSLLPIFTPTSPYLRSLSCPPCRTLPNNPPGLLQLREAPPRRRRRRALRILDEAVLVPPLAAPLTAPPDPPAGGPLIEDLPRRRRRG